MWNIPGIPAPTERFKPFEPADILYEFDGPRIFSVQDSDGELNLAYWSDENDQGCRYVVVPTTTKILLALKQGSISVFDALDQPRCWLVDANHEGELTGCQRVEFEAIPRDSLPAIGTMLLPSLEPLLEPLLVDLEGRIRELDKDRLSFELREIDGTTRIQRFVFDEGLLEEVSQSFQEGIRVRVAGRTFPVKNVAYALALSKVN